MASAVAQGGGGGLESVEPSLGYATDKTVFKSKDLTTFP